MKIDEWWKNFGLGRELHISGTFIYNAITALDSLDILNYTVDIFEILYNLSVGVERLLKVAIVLVEYEDWENIREFEESLISHNTMELANRVDTKCKLDLSNIHLEFLSLLSKFYKSHRYMRYSLDSVPNIDAEKVAFLEFLIKHLNLTIHIEKEFEAINNTDQIRKFVGKVVKRISDSLFKVIKKRSRALNIYTDEIRTESKAFKVFYGERLDFIYEKLKKKEIILYLMSEKAKGEDVEILRSFDALNLGQEMISSYIKALLNDQDFFFIEGEIDECYSELANTGDRIEFLQIIDIMQHWQFATDNGDN